MTCPLCYGKGFIAGNPYPCHRCHADPGILDGPRILKNPSKRDLSQFCELCGAEPYHDGMCEKCVRAYSNPDPPPPNECLRRWLS